MAMFGKGFGLVDPATAQTASYGLPQLSGDVVAAGTAQARPDRWLDGGKFTAKDAIGLALGAIGDAFSGQSNIANMVNRSFQQQRQLKLAEQQRQQEMDDWQRKQMWVRANPKPVNNDTIADYQFITQTLGADAGKQFLQNKANPPVWRQGPDGQFYRIDTPQGAAGSVLPTFTQDDWDKAGGGAGNSAGGFR